MQDANTNDDCNFFPIFSFHEQPTSARYIQIPKLDKIEWWKVRHAWVGRVIFSCETSRDGLFLTVLSKVLKSNVRLASLQVCNLQSASLQFCSLLVCNSAVCSLQVCKSAVCKSAVCSLQVCKSASLQSASLQSACVAHRFGCVL